jgi:putative ABC transport system permease protein
LFGGGVDVLGQTIFLDGDAFEVVGVMPQDFKFLHQVDLWVPMVFGEADLEDPGNLYISVIGRLKEGQTLATAREDMDRVALEVVGRFPALSGWGATATSLRASLVGDVRTALLVLLGVVGFLLLVACSNVANLLLARAAERETEVAVRQALGAGRGRLIRQLLTESVLLSLIGCAFGLVLAWFGIRILVKTNPGSIPRIDEIHLDTTAFLVSLLIALITGVLFGLVPALRAARTNLAEAFGTRREGGQAVRWLRSFFVVAEVAMALVLLVGAGLMVRSSQKLGQVDPGFDPRGSLTATVLLSSDLYPEAFQRTAFLEQVLDRLRQMPGVKSAGAVTTLPLTGASVLEVFRIPGRPPTNLPSSGMLDSISPGLFQAMGIPLLKGRDFEAEDRAGGQPVVIINETLGKLYWPGESPVGQTMNIPYVNTVPHQVVGVVADVKRDGLDAETPASFYLPFRQFFTEPGMYLVVRGTGDNRTGDNREALVAALRGAVNEVNPEQQVASLQGMEELFAASTAQRRFNVGLMSVAAVIALILAVLGIYGVLAYSVAQQTREIGIRMALGAERSGVLRMVLKEGLQLVLLGIGLGFVAALGLAQLMASLLFGVEPSDPLTYLAITLLFVVVGLVASYLPALRATRVNPMVALRSE